MNELLNEMPNEDQLGDKELPTVVVTGFGLFRNYSVNPSSECVKRLQLKDVNLITKQIEVIYEEVDECVASIWTKHKPMLVIHCGVSCLATCITLETRAVIDPTLYEKPDIKGCLPNSGDHKKCSNDSLDCIESEINLKKVCDEVNQHFMNGSIRMGAVLSSNAGRYLCEYIFRTSLKESSSRTAFIHVPEISDTCPLEDIHSALELTIKVLIKEVMKTNKSSVL